MRSVDLPWTRIIVNRPVTARHCHRGFTLLLVVSRGDGIGWGGTMGKPQRACCRSGPRLKTTTIPGFARQRCEEEFLKVASGACVCVCV
jgi:hypothetical protein